MDDKWEKNGSTIVFYRTPASKNCEELYNWCDEHAGVRSIDWSSFSYPYLNDDSTRMMKCITFYFKDDVIAVQFKLKFF